ncbi:hypothetical protein Syun_013340 [Stephania yunnanensis]|uniref:Uncharacterized protein n=1 Tax=Stephania yunnanensis TaxID=152371 RepID=A0AAP0K3B5_9MAGN
MDHKDQCVGEVVGVWDCGSPLYDSFELVSLSHLIERNLMVLPFSSTKQTNQVSNVFDSSPVGVVRSDEPSKQVKIEGLSLGLFFKAHSYIWKRRSMKNKKLNNIAAMAAQQSNNIQAFGVWDCGSPLYDAFELVSMAHIIDRNLTMATPSSSNRGEPDVVDSVSKRVVNRTVEDVLGAQPENKGLFSSWGDKLLGCMVFMIKNCCH